MYQLEIIEGPQAGTIFKLEENGLYTMGRAEDNTLVLADTQISAHHAKIFPEQDQFFLEDMGSTNGTYVNDKRITSCPLASRDNITIGRMVMRFSKSHTSRILQKNPEEPPVYVEESPDDSKPSFDMVLKHRNLFASGNFFEDEELVAMITRNRNLLALYKISNLLVTEYDIGSLLERILDLVFEVSQPQRAVVLRFDTDASHFTVLTQRVQDVETLTDQKLTVSKTILSHVLDTRESIVSADAMADKRFSTKSIFQYHIQSVMCVPILAHANIMGVLYIDTITGENPFTQEHLELVTAIGQFTGMAMENINLMKRQLKDQRLAAIGEAMAELSHYIKNILQGMLGGKTLVSKGIQEKNFHYIETGWKVLDRSNFLISDLVLNMLNYSRTKKPHFATESALDVIREVYELAAGITDKKNIRTSCHANPDNLLINVDRDSFKRALFNLIINATDAIPSERDGTIVISAARTESGNEILFSVSDNGCGISAKNFNRIFELFVTTKRHEATGIGLAVTKKIVEEHEGSIWIESQVDKGTTFFIKIPVSPS